MIYQSCEGYVSACLSLFISSFTPFKFENSLLLSAFAVVKSALKQFSNNREINFKQLLNKFSRVGYLACDGCRGSSVGACEYGA